MLSLCTRLSRTVVVLCLITLSSAVRAQSVLASSQDQPETRQRPQVPLDVPDQPGGPWTPPDGVADPDVPEDGVPNLAVTSVQIVDGGNNPMTPVAGKRFWVRVNFSYANPVCTSYAIRRVVNGWEHDAPEINWGCGLKGTTFWTHFWGAWVMHHGGTYSVTLTLDANNAIAESNEADNTVTLNFGVNGTLTAEWALVGAETGLSLLGDGTDVIVGTMDDAFDFNHPWFTGVDSRGRPRLVAANQNILGEDGGPVNAGHATAVMGIVLARGENEGDITGLAPDARYVTAEFINRADIPGLQVLHVLNAAGFLVENGAEVINMSWSWWFGSSQDSQSGEGSVTNLMTDYLAYGRNIVCVPAVNQLAGFDRPTAPGAARNAMTVGGLKDNLQEAWGPQDHGPTLDGRSKPDLLGNDSANAVAPSSSWRNGFPAGEGFGGTSFAAPFVTGAVAQMLDFGKHNGQSTDHRVIKAIIMNSAVKALDDDGSPWSNSPTQPLDDEQGTGILDLVRAHAMYSSGEQSPDVVGTDQVQYAIGTLPAGTLRFDATLVWDRHTLWSDGNNSGLIDAGDFFFVSPTDQQDNLDLVVYRDGVEVAASRSTVDNVEHISVADPDPGEYRLAIERMFVANTGNGEEYAVAWYADGAPAVSGYDFGGVLVCPWDCGGDDDGNIGITDFLELLAQWGTPGSCDFDGGGVGINDFLGLLANWGPCP